jgi:threonine aldolase
MNVNLVSDTVTKPTPEMLRAMMAAEVGDDVFREDPTIAALEDKLARKFGKEAGLFCPSGTMTNQLAIKVNTQPLDEVICHKLAHVHQSEGGAYAFHSGVSMTVLEGPDGKIAAGQISAAIKPAYDWTPRSTLVVIENTCNIAGGSITTLAEVEQISNLCRERGIRMHLDGARIFNALCETGESPLDWGSHFDTVSVCLSKGLGAPAGSVLLGTEDRINFARRLRKIFGGGMRQAGYFAAAGIYALDHHVDRLKDDHRRAKKLAEVLANLTWVTDIRPVVTNILIFDVLKPESASSILAKLKEHGIKAASFGPQTIRFVTHLDFTAEMLDYVEATLRKIK